MKKKFYSEMAYILGLVLLAIGTALMERANLGMSMVVAPAYLCYLKVSQYYSFFTFGMAEYCFQALLLIILGLVIGRFKIKFAFSFVTAFIYGNILDAMMYLVGLIGVSDTVVWRIVFFLTGMLICSLGVALLFNTYISPEAYELFVKEFSVRYDKSITIVKTIYDCCSCLLAVALSFIFMGFGHFEGVKLGTVFCALVNGLIIGKCSQLLEKRFEFCDGLGLRYFFS